MCSELYQICLKEHRRAIFRNFRSALNVREDTTTDTFPERMQHNVEP